MPASQNKKTEHAAWPAYRRYRKANAAAIGARPMLSPGVRASWVGLGWARKDSARSAHARLHACTRRIAPRGVGTKAPLAGLTLALVLLLYFTHYQPRRRDVCAIVSYLRTDMLGIAPPNFALRVEQPASTFAEGNARWCVGWLWLWSC
jgi:hypothetical protein